MVEALKGIKIDDLKNFKNHWSSGKKVSLGVLHQMEGTWKVTEV